MVSIEHKIVNGSAMVIIQPCDRNQVLDRSLSTCDSSSARLPFVVSPTCQILGDFGEFADSSEAKVNNMDSMLMTVYCMYEVDVEDEEGGRVESLDWHLPFSRSALPLPTFPFPYNILRISWQSSSLNAWLRGPPKRSHSIVESKTKDGNRKRYPHPRLQMVTNYKIGLISGTCLRLYC